MEDKGLITRGLMVSGLAIDWPIREQEVCVLESGILGMRGQSSEVVSYFPWNKVQMIQCLYLSTVSQY